jgi:TRAP-type C4-dicarboxylate transport system permease small subunit
MRALSTLYDRVLAGLGLVPGLLVAVIAVGTCADVLLRNLGYSGLYGMLEVIEFSLLVLTMAGVGYIMRIGRHVTVDILAEYLPQRYARPVMLIATLLATIISVIFLYIGFLTALDSYQSGATIQKEFVIPEWLPVSTIPIGFFFLTVELIRRLAIILTSGAIAGTGGTSRDGGI